MALHPDLVGQRVVVRRLLGGSPGPSGGPAMTDVLGILEAWSSEQLSVRTEDGDLVSIAQADTVTAKPVPPRPSPRQRISPEALERIAAEGWQAHPPERLGDWLLRHGAGFTGRANSVLMGGDPGLPMDEALAVVVGYYHDRGLRPMAQTIVDSPELHELDRRGWVRSRPHEADAVVEVASVAQALRLARRRSGESHSAVYPPAGMTASTVEVQIDDQLTDDWVDRYGRTADLDPAVVRACLTSGGQVGFARVGHPAVAIGRAVVTGDWMGIGAVEVDPAWRRQGLAVAVVDALLDWGASLGALSAYLQAVGDNRPALALYEGYGFRTHHRYRYLSPPG